MISAPPSVSQTETLPTPQIVAAALGRLAAADQILRFVVDLTDGVLLHLEGPLEDFVGMDRSALIADPSAWLDALDAFDRAAVGDLVGELAVNPRLERIFLARGKNGRKRVLRGIVVRHEIAGRAVLAGSAMEVGAIDGPLGDTDPFRQAVEHAREGLAVTDAQGCYLYLNREHVRLFGYDSADELIGRSWRLLYSEEGAARIEREVFPVLAAKGFWHGRLIARRRDGSTFHESLTLSLLPGGRIVCNCYDVTEEVAMAERLRENEALFRLFLNALPIGVMIRRTRGPYEFVNEAAALWLAREADAASAPAGIAHCLADAGIFRYWSAADERIAAGTDDLRFDFPVVWGGRSWVLDVKKLPLRNSAGAISHVCTLVFDVTDQRRLEVEAAETSRRKDEYFVMQRQFVSMVSHEFRTPLTSIQGVHFLLSRKLEAAAGDGLGTFRPEARRLLSLQEHALHTLRELVDQVLMLNRLEHMTAEIEPRVVSAAAFVSALVATLNGPLSRPRIVLNLEVPPEFSVPVLEAPLRSAIENLVSNGLKYSSAKTEVAVTVRADRTHWYVEVADAGRGIPEPDRKSLFEPFHRAGNVGNISGTGLGLTIVKRVVVHHGGTVSYTSAVGIGTTFTAALPLELPTLPAGPAWQDNRAKPAAPPC